MGLRIIKGLASPNYNSIQICAPILGLGSVCHQALPTGIQACCSGVFLLRGGRYGATGETGGQ